MANRTEIIKNISRLLLSQLLLPNSIYQIKINVLRHLGIVFFGRVLPSRTIPKWTVEWIQHILFCPSIYNSSLFFPSFDVVFKTSQSLSLSLAFPICHCVYFSLVYLIIVYHLWRLMICRLDDISFFYDLPIVVVVGLSHPVCTLLLSIIRVFYGLSFI